MEVKFGMLVEKDEVFVQLQAADHSPHSQSRSSSPHRSSDSARSPKEQAIARVVVKAARFVLEKLRQLRSDAARAHLELLKGGLQCMRCGVPQKCLLPCKAEGAIPILAREQDVKGAVVLCT